MVAFLASKSAGANPVTLVLNVARTGMVSRLVSKPAVDESVAAGPVKAATLEMLAELLRLPAAS